MSRTSRVSAALTPPTNKTATAESAAAFTVDPPFDPRTKGTMIHGRSSPG